jgi:AhpD family alkylhydroperoxidase
MELLAQQLQTGAMQGACADDAATPDVYEGGFEIGYSHYHFVDGVDLPHTLKHLESDVRSRAATQGVWNLAWSSLSHASLALCADALEAACGAARATRGCGECAGVHQHPLRVAGCTDNEIRAWCPDWPGKNTTVAVL